MHLIDLRLPHYGIMGREESSRLVRRSPEISFALRASARRREGLNESSPARSAGVAFLKALRPGRDGRLFLHYFPALRRGLFSLRPSGTTPDSDRQEPVPTGFALLRSPADKYSPTS
jgi:hypothetical protein